MTLSIRGRLLLWIVAGMTVLLVVLGAVIYDVVSNSLRGDFDAVLTSTARTIYSSVEQDAKGVRVEIDDRELPEFYRGVRPDYFQLRDEHGSTIAKSPSLVSGDLDPLEGPPDSLLFREVRLPDDRAGRAVRFTFVPKIDEDGARTEVLPRKLSLVVARETAGLDSRISRLQWFLGGATGATIMLALIVGAVGVQRGLRPLGVLASRIDAIQQDDMSARIDVGPMPAEIGPVVHRLNDLLERLEEAFARERALTANAAHELRTPLAGMRSVLEVSLSRRRDGDEYRQAMTECLEVVEHTQAMVDNLLALARLEGEQIHLHPEFVSVAEVVRAVWNPLIDRAQARLISVDIDVPSELGLGTDRESLRLVLRILLANAVEYTNKGGQIRVEASGGDDSIDIAVVNSGWELPEDAAERVFERFWRGDTSRADTGIHCGLGLSLAQRIVGLLGGTIVATAKGDVFTIRVTLPASNFRSGVQTSVAVQV